MQSLLLSRGIWLTPTWKASSPGHSVHFGPSFDASPQSWTNTDKNKRKFETSPQGWFLHHLLEHHQLQGPTHLEQDWLKGFSTGTAISCRGKVTCIQCYRVMCAWKRGKSTEARVRSEDDCQTGSPQKTTRSPQQCLGASGVVGCNCNDCYTCVVYANTAVQFPFFTHTLSYFPY